MKNLTRILFLAALLSGGLTACHSKTTGNTGSDSASTTNSGSGNGNGAGSGMAADSSNNAKGSDSTQMKDTTKR